MNTMRNPLQRFLIKNKIKAVTLSEVTNIERTRVHRLIHSERLENVLTVGELRKIMTAFPDAELDFFN